MFRFFAAGAAIAVLTAIPAANAQNTEAQWQILMSQAMSAAGRNDYPRAEQLLLKARQESEKFGPRDGHVGTTLNTLGLVYRAEKKFSEAEAAYRRALDIMEAAYGESIDVGNVNFNIVGVMFDQGHQAEALPTIRRALAIYEKLLGSTSLKTAGVLCMEGDAYRSMKRYAESEEPLKQCADIREEAGGLENADLADALHSLALTYIAEGKFSAAEPRLKLAEKIREKTAGITSPLLAENMEDRAAVLRQLGRDPEAQKLLAMAAAIRRGQKSK